MASQRKGYCRSMLHVLPIVLLVLAAFGASWLGGYPNPQLIQLSASLVAEPPSRGALSIALLASSSSAADNIHIHNNADAMTSLAVSLRSSFRVSTTKTMRCHDDKLCKEQQTRVVQDAVRFVDVVAYFSTAFTSSSRCHEGVYDDDNSLQIKNNNNHTQVTADVPQHADHLTNLTFRRDLEVLVKAMGQLQMLVVIVAHRDEANFATEFFNDVTMSNDKEYRARRVLPALVLLHATEVVGVGFGSCACGLADTVYSTAIAQALSTGRIDIVKHPETQLSHLTLSDLHRAVEALVIGRHALTKQASNAFVLASFNTTVGRAAAEVAAVTGAVLTFHDEAPPPTSSSEVWNNDLSYSTSPNDVIPSFAYMGTEATTVRDLVRVKALNPSMCSRPLVMTSTKRRQLDEVSRVVVPSPLPLLDRHQVWMAGVLAAIGKNVSVVGYDLDTPFLQAFASATNKTLRNLLRAKGSGGSSPAYTGVPSCEEESSLLLVVAATSLADWHRSIRPNIRTNALHHDNPSGARPICNRSHVWVMLLVTEEDGTMPPRLLSWTLGTNEEREVSTTTGMLSPLIMVPSSPPPPPLQLLPNRRQVVLVSHFFNEAFMLPYFIRHHASMFDRAVLIDCGSTDDSVEIIKALAPSTWEVVPSKHPNVFHYKLTDDEVMEHENRFPGWWKIALTVAEFLVHPNFRSALHRLDMTHRKKRAFRYRSVIMTGDDVQPLGRFEQLMSQRREYVLTTKIYGTDRVDPVYEADPSSYLTWYSRFLHQFSGTSYYHNGRHTVDVPGARNLPMMPDGFIAKWMYTPWPDALNRRASVGKKIPKEHLGIDRGTHHALNTTQLNLNRDRVRQSPRLRLNDVYAHCDNVVTQAVHRAWRETFLRPIEFHHECVGAGLPRNVDRYYHRE